MGRKKKEKSRNWLMGDSGKLQETRWEKRSWMGKKSKIVGKKKLERRKESG